MEEIQDDCQSPSDWGSMQDLASWSINGPEKGEGIQPRTTREDLVNDLKRAETTFSTVTISNTTPSWIKITHKVPLLKPAHVKARLKFAKDHLDDPEEAWEKVM